MSVDEKIADALISCCEKNKMGFQLKLKDKTIPLSDVSIFRSKNPVDRPTRRGGVYMSGKYSYKLKGTINDTSIITLLSNTMLGPNTDFSEIEITTSMPIDGENKPVSIFTYLTNSMHNSEKIDLNLIVVRIEY